MKDKVKFKHVAVICPFCGEEYGGVPDKCDQCHQEPEEWWLRVLVTPEEIEETSHMPFFMKIAERAFDEQKEQNRIKWIKSKFMQIYNNENKKWALIDRELRRIVGYSEEMYEYVPEYEGT